MKEAEIQHAIREALGQELDLVLWRNAIAHAEKWDATSGAVSHVRAGLPDGSADLVGVLAPSGRWFALEVKSEKGRLRPAQVQWLALVRRMGGFAAVARSVAEARAALGRARAGASE
jgi:hypothetical protein